MYELKSSYPELKITEQSLNAILNDICAMLRAPRDSLGIFASCKGVWAGSISYTTGQAHIDASLFPQGISIPNDLSNIQTSAKLVVVIEKDAVFQRLLRQNFLQDLELEAIMITGWAFQTCQAKPNSSA